MANEMHKSEMGLPDLAFVTAFSLQRRRYVETEKYHPILKESAFHEAGSTDPTTSFTSPGDS
jgi:hypothetical protein